MTELLWPHAPADTGASGLRISPVGTDRRASFEWQLVTAGIRARAGAEAQLRATGRTKMTQYGAPSLGLRSVLPQVNAS